MAYHKHFYMSEVSNPVLNEANNLSYSWGFQFKYLIINPLIILVKDSTFNTIDYSRIFRVENFHFLALFLILTHPQGIKATGNVPFQVRHLRHKIPRFITVVASQDHYLYSRFIPQTAIEVSCWDLPSGKQCLMLQAVQ